MTLRGEKRRFFSVADVGCIDRNTVEAFTSAECAPISPEGQQSEVKWRCTMRQHNLVFVVASAAIASLSGPARHLLERLAFLAPDRVPEQEGKFVRDALSRVNLRTLSL
jgi:hypothetical protein